MVRVGDLNTFENFIVHVHRAVDRPFTPTVVIR